MTTYHLSFELADGTAEEPFLTKTNKAHAFWIARDIAKTPSWNAVAVWVEDAERNGIKKFPIKKPAE